MSIATRSPVPGGSHQRPGDTEVEGNARLTASTGLVLLVLFAVQVGTVVASVKSHLTPHVVVGLLLVPPLVVKLGAVSWRFVRYYQRDPAYQRKGPPTPALRILGPALLLTTVSLFVSGITLLLAPTAFGGPRGAMFYVHDGSFYLWTLLLVGHLAGHRRDLRRLALRDWVGRTRATVRRAPLRQAIVLLSLAAGLALALSLVGHVRGYQHVLHHARVASGEGATRTGAVTRDPAGSARPLRRGALVDVVREARRA